MPEPFEPASADLFPDEFIAEKPPDSDPARVAVAVVVTRHPAIGTTEHQRVNAGQRIASAIPRPLHATYWRRTQVSV